MRKLSGLLALIPVLMIGCQKDVAKENQKSTVEVSAVSETGNGAPSGSHYQINIIGVSNPKTTDMTDNNGHRIFVSLTDKSNIYLTEGDFAVLDANGTDKDGASFQLPAPDADCDGNTDYSVFARALGKPGGSATVTNCATYDGEVICETNTEEILEVQRNPGRTRFTNVTKKLLYIYVDITDDGVDNPQRYPIFDDRLQDYYWEYDNNGLKVLQLRFYPVSTTVSPCPI